MNAQELPVRISVIIPAFNEQGIIGQTVQETVRALTGCDYEIVVVDDGSHDGTRAEARQAAEGNARVQVVGYDKNEGKGWALRYGFEQTDGDLVALLDADLDLHPAQLWTLWKVMQETGADVVIGSKQHPQSRVNYPWQRRMISTAYFLLIRWLFGLPLRDTQTGLKLFRRQVLQDVFPRMQVKGFAFDLELLVAADRFGYRTRRLSSCHFDTPTAPMSAGGRSAVYSWTQRTYSTSPVFGNGLSPAQETNSGCSPLSRV